MTTTGNASNEARAAQDDYFHILIFGFRCFRFHDDGIIIAL